MSKNHLKGGDGMPNEDLVISAQDLRRLLAAACPEAALLYLYLHAGHPQEKAAEALRLSERQFDFAAASLRQLGLYPEPQPKHVFVQGEAPVYTERDVTEAYAEGTEFPNIVGEAQRRLGRVLSTEELKILLCIYRYLGLPCDVISILLNHCIQKSRARGTNRLPSLRTIEKEAYHWADLGIDTMERAAAYMQEQLRLQSGIGRIRKLLQIDGRRLTPSEEKFVQSWLDWGFSDEVISMAYEKTCMNTGSLKWPYMNTILKSWHEKGLLTPAAIAAGDRAPTPAQSKSRGFQKHDGELSEFAKRAVARMMKEPIDEEG